MTLGDKLRSLRSVEGSLRGLGRAMTQFELAQAMKREVGRGLSQAYLSQIESGARPHLTHTTRELLARFFRVYPGFLVDDPEGYTATLQSELRVARRASCWRDSSAYTPAFWWTIRRGTPRRCSPSYAWQTPRSTRGSLEEPSSFQLIRS